MQRKITISQSIKILLIGVFASALMTISQRSLAQTNPTAYDLSSGNWTLNGWASNVPAASYPGNGSTGLNNTTGVVAGAANANMVFWKGSTAADLTVASAPTGDYTGTYTGGSRTVIGSNASGVTFDNTSGSGGIGYACLAVKTTGRSNIGVSWTSSLIVAGAREYGVRLQYRVGTTGAFVDADATPANILLDCPANQTVPFTQNFSITLPAAAENQTVVQLLWRFYFISGSGTRPELSIDDITVSSTALATPTKFVITNISPATPTAGSGFNVTVKSEDNSNIPGDVTSATGFTLSTNGNAGTIGGTTTGTIAINTRTVTVTGVTLSSGGTGATVTATQSSGMALSAGTSSTFTVTQPATKYAFLGEPAGGSTATALSTFTVRALRPDNSLDNTYAGNITISEASGPGAISGTLTVAAVAGIATFSNVQFSATGTVTMQATGSLTTATTGNINIVTAALGNLSILQAGNGTETLANTGNSLFIKNYKTDGTSPTTFATIPNSGVNALVESGNAGSEGSISLSGDGQNIIINGYNTTTGIPFSASVSGTSTTVNPILLRAIGNVDASGTYTLASTTTQFSANNTRGATGDGGNNYWIDGANTGIVYSGAGPSAIVSSTSVNNRVMAVYNGNLYFSSGSGTHGIYQVTGEPISGTNTATLVVPTTAASSSYAFSFSPDGNTCFIADDRNYGNTGLTNASNTGGIQKWQNISGTWTLLYTIGVDGAGNSATTTVGAFGLTVDWTNFNSSNGYGAIIYVTTTNAVANKLVRAIDGTTPTVSTLATAAAATVFRGIVTAPVAGSDISLSNSTLAGFGYFTGSGPSTEQTFTVTGTNLTNNITLTAPTDYEISTTTGSGFSGSVTLTQSGGSVATTTIYVRLKAGLALANYNNENIACTSTGAASPNMWCSGSVLGGANVSVSTLSGFNYGLGSGPSASQSFTCSGAGLTADITLTAPTHYEISLTSGSGYGATLTLTQSGGNVAPTTIFVRLKAGLSAGNYNSEVLTAATTGYTNATLTLSGTVNTGAFSSGNLAVEVMGDGTTTLSSSGCQVNVWEYDATGALQNTFAFPHAGSVPSSAPFNLMESGSATSAGLLNRSSDGKLITVAGYNGIIGTASIVSTSSATNARTLGYIDNTGSINANNAYNIFSGNNFRSIASNGFSFWGAGTVTGGAGLYYFFDASTAPVSLGNVNTRYVKIFNGNLYYSSASSGNVGIYQIGTNGLPIAIDNVATTLLTDVTYKGVGSPYGFEINPAGNIMYIADDGSWANTSTEKGGILKYTKVGATWTYQYTMRVYPATTSGARGVTVDWTGDGAGHPYVYATAAQASNLVKIVDNGTGADIGTILASAPNSKYAFRGVVLSPVANATPTVYSTASAVAFPGEPVGGISQEKTFNVSGANLTGNLTVTVPSGYGIWTATGGNSGVYPTSVSLTPSSGSVNATVYVVFQPTVLGVDNGNITLAATGATTVNVPVTGTAVTTTNYYNVAGADILLLSSWGTNTDGSGSNPADFNLSDGEIFNLTHTYTENTTTETVSPQGLTFNGGNQLVFASPVSLPDVYSAYIGAAISGTGIQPGTTITSFGTNVINISLPATIDAASPVTFTVTTPTGAGLTINGTLSKLVVGDGSVANTFTAASGFPFTGVVDVKASSTLTLQDLTIPTFGTLDNTSTVIFNQVSTVNIPDGTGFLSGTASYGNLTLSGSSLVATLPQASSITPLPVNGNLTIDGAIVFGNGGISHTYIQLTGNLTCSNSADFLANRAGGTGVLFSVITNGNGNQAISYPNGTIALYTLTSTKSAGSLTLGNNTALVLNGSSGTFHGFNLNYSGNASFVSNPGSSLNGTGSANIELAFTGTSSFTLGGDMNGADATSNTLTPAVTPSTSIYMNFASGTSFDDGGNTITSSGDLGMAGVAGAYNLTGTVVMTTSNSSSRLENDGSFGVIVPALNNLTFAPLASGSTNLIVEPATGSATIVVKGDLTITGAGTSAKLAPNGNIIKVGSNFSDSRTIDMIAASTSTFEFNGTAAQTINVNYNNGETFNNVKINNANGVTMIGTASIKINGTGNLNVASGILNTGTHKVLLNNTATITESNDNYVLGSVQITHTLSQNVNDQFGGIGLEINAAGAAPGSTKVIRTTTSSNVGCTGTSILRNFAVTATVNTGLNAAVVFHYLDDAAGVQMNGFAGNELSLYSLTTGPWTLISNSVADVVGQTFTATGLNSIGQLTAAPSNPKAGTAVATGGTTLNPNTVICNNTGTNITLTGFSGGLQWEVSADGQTNWGPIIGATNATYNTGNLTATAYYRALVSNACFDIASNSVKVNVQSASPSLALTLTSNLASGTVAASWTPNAVNSGVQYNIAWSGASNGSLNSVNSGLTIPGLNAGGNYTVTVSEVNPAGCPANGTATINTLCAAPVLTLSNAVAGGFTASWTNVGATSYRLFFKRAGYPSFNSVIITGTSHVFGGLYKGDSYICYVAANDCPVNGQLGLQSAEQYITTLPNASSCTIPVVTAVSNCANQITVTLSGSPSGKYNVVFGRLAPNPSASVSYPVTGSTINITVGTQNASSTWQIYATSNCGNGTVSIISNPVYVVIKPGCTQLQNLVLSTPDCHGFEATWNADNCSGNLVGYAIYVRKQGSLNYSAYPQPNNFVHVNWVPAGVYSAYVAAVGCNGSVGPVSAIQTIATGVGCKEDGDDNSDDNSTLTTHDNGANASMVIYPNPTSGNFMVNVYSKDASEQNIKIEMTNSLGQVVYTVITPVTNGISNNAFQVPENFASGIYFIHTVVNGTNLSQRIMYSK